MNTLFEYVFALTVVVAGVAVIGSVAFSVWARFTK